jgi:hypothetical protein
MPAWPEQVETALEMQDVVAAGPQGYASYRAMEASMASLGATCSADHAARRRTGCYALVVGA